MGILLSLARCNQNNTNPSFERLSSGSLPVYVGQITGGTITNVELYKYAVNGQ